MAYIELNTAKLKNNYTVLNQMFQDYGIEWGIVSKVLCGHKSYLQELINLGVKQILDSRIANLKTVKSLNPNIETVFIKPPAIRSIPNVIRYADVSFNTEYKTIRLLSEEAVKQNKRHKIVIMIELGELREGVMRNSFLEFYENVFQLPNIEIAGIGTNLTCMYGVLPNHDKLIQLCLYKQLIEAKFNMPIPYVTGGTSVTIPLIKKGLLPHGVNHFRVGEALFLGTDVYNQEPNPDLFQDVFKLYADIIELSEKPVIPDGEMGVNLLGQSHTATTEAVETSYRAIVDIGLLDVQTEHITPVDKTCKVVGSSSDMMVIDLGERYHDFKVGGRIAFDVNYMGLLRIMNCDYVEKRIV
jgi:predicted amino acid racemase